MSEQEFENWLSLLAGLLQLSPEQRKSISNELRSHLEERMEDLIDAGSSREEAIATALEEFGDTAALAHHFTSNAHLQRRRLMRYTYGTIAAVTCAILVLATFWPQQDGQVMQNVVAQSATEENGVTDAQLVTPEKQPKSPFADSRAKIETLLAEPWEVEFIDVPLTKMLDSLSEQKGIAIFIDPRVRDEIDTGQTINFRVGQNVMSGKTLLDDFILGPLELGYMIRDNCLIVSTIEEIEAKIMDGTMSNMEVAVYNCRDLLTPEQLAEPLQAPDGADAVSERTSAVSDFEGEGIAELPVELCALQFGGGKGVTHQPAQGAAAAEEQLIQVIANTVAPGTWNGPFGSNISHEGASNFPGSIDAINGLIVIKHTREVHKQVEQLLQLMREAKDEHGLGNASYSYPRWKPALPVVGGINAATGAGGGGFF